MFSLYTSNITPTHGFRAIYRFVGVHNNIAMESILFVENNIWMYLIDCGVYLLEQLTKPINLLSKKKFSQAINERKPFKRSFVSYLKYYLVWF